MKVELLVKLVNVTKTCKLMKLINKNNYLSHVIKKRLGNKIRLSQQSDRPIIVRLYQVNINDAIN